MDKELLDGEDVFVIHEFLSYPECDGLIARSEALGYEAATVGDVLVTEFRNNARVILDDPDLAATLWDRARPFVPQGGGWEALGFHDRFRFYRYDLAESFAPHFDGSVCRGADEESRLTFMVYLNEGCEGAGPTSTTPAARRSSPSGPSEARPWSSSTSNFTREPRSRAVGSTPCGRT